MYLTKLSLKNIRSFKSLDQILASKNINVLIGANNSGKSTILKAIFSLFHGISLKVNDIRVNEGFGEIIGYIDGQDLNRIHFAGNRTAIFGELNNNFKKYITVGFPINNNPKKTLHYNSGDEEVMMDFQPIEDHNVIIPFLSNRKVVHFDETINENVLSQSSGTFTNLYAKIDRLSNPSFSPANKEYKEACESILGFYVSTTASPSGKKAALILHNKKHIALDSMGEGIINILGLIVELCLAENKIFLIEELENDIHPKALKILLELIIKKSENNQFFISTHSNIIAKQLGSINTTKLFQLKMTLAGDDIKIPETTILEVKNEPDARRAVLEDLGYEFTDYELYEGWLFFEESSIEEIVRQYFIPWYFKNTKFQNFRTFSARSISEIEAKFEDFNRLFVYLHLTDVYRNKAWVIIDAGVNEEAIINKMRKTYKARGWNEENFLQLSEHNFENYYPEIFAQDIKLINADKNPKTKLESKAKLLQKVKKWIIENEGHAKTEFATSARPIIEMLQKINQRM